MTGPEFQHELPGLRGSCCVWLVPLTAHHWLQYLALSDADGVLPTCPDSSNLTVLYRKTNPSVKDAMMKEETEATAKLHTQPCFSETAPLSATPELIWT